jgi:large subunit ribosomal protein L4
VNKKMKRGALRSALTDALRSEKLVVLKDLVLDEPKTKAAAQLLDALEIEGGKVLVVLPAPSDTGAVEKSFRNIQGVRVSYAKSLGVYEIVAADRLVLTTAALDVLEGSPEEGTPTEAGAAQAAGTTTREAGEDA